MKIRLNRFPGGKHKALTMSYDDGVGQDMRLIEIFNHYGIKGSFHLNSGLATGTDNFNRIPITKFAEVYRGHEISAHALTHPFLETLSQAEVVFEMLEDRRNLEQVAGYPVRGMSYPYGTYSERVLEILQTVGIEYARTVRTTNGFQLPQRFLEWEATCHHKDATEELAQRFLDEANWERPSLLYVWGHSYEFDNDKNWDLIENFCKTVGNNEAIWYATNIEVFDYVTAMRSLRFSVNRDVVFNPSACTVWISVDNESVAIAPGETVRLFARRD